MPYTRSATRSPGAGTARWMDLRYAGTCSVGTEHEHALAGGDRAFFDPRDRSTTCTDMAHAKAAGLTTKEWFGSPTSGSYVEVLSAHRPAMFVGERPAPRARRGRVVVTRFSSGATVYRNAAGRCIDAPCCGCCTG